jgi:hypothetical protein
MPKVPSKREGRTRNAGTPGDDDRCPVCDMRPCGCPTF